MVSVDCQIATYELMGRSVVDGLSTVDLPEVVLEPIRGGRLSNNVPPSVGAGSPRPYKRALAEWALQWVWNQTI